MQVNEAKTTHIPSSETKPSPELSAAPDPEALAALGAAIDFLITKQPWEYIETTHSAYVFARPYKIDVHWGGTVNPEEIRSLMRFVAATPALYQALKDILARGFNGTLPQARNALALANGQAASEQKG